MPRGKKGERGEKCDSGSDGEDDDKRNNALDFDDLFIGGEYTSRKASKATVKLMERLISEGKDLQNMKPLLNESISEIDNEIAAFRKMLKYAEMAVQFQHGLDSGVYEEEDDDDSAGKTEPVPGSSRSLGVEASQGPGKEPTSLQKDAAQTDTPYMANADDKGVEQKNIGEEDCVSLSPEQGKSAPELLEENEVAANDSKKEDENVQEALERPGPSRLTRSKLTKFGVITRTNNAKKGENPVKRICM